jgi:hypothetical protein
MNKFIKFLSVCALVLSTTACTRVGTGEVGLRVDASRQVQSGELQPGSWNQEMIGDVLIFPVRDIQVDLNNKNPMTSDNSVLEDFDASVVYSLNPSMVSDIFTKKSKTFHATNEDGQILLMFNYMHNLINNASYKAVRGFSTLQVADKRVELESEIRRLVDEKLQSEGLGAALTITAVNVRQITPNRAIVTAANDAIKAQADLKKKETEVQIAEAESRRMKALSESGNASIDYMDAQSRQTIANAIAQGKVQTIVLPMDFKGMVNIK